MHLTYKQCTTSTKLPVVCDPIKIAQTGQSLPSFFPLVLFALVTSAHSEYMLLRYMQGEDCLWQAVKGHTLRQNKRRVWETESL